jgi:predicted membrane-bound dolichyl-phosphate-mannose-protein mannosyltransferase
MDKENILEYIKKNHDPSMKTIIFLKKLLEDQNIIIKLKSDIVTLDGVEFDMGVINKIIKETLDLKKPCSK